MALVTTLNNRFIKQEKQKNLKVLKRFISIELSFTFHSYRIEKSTDFFLSFGLTILSRLSRPLLAKVKKSALQQKIWPLIASSSCIQQIGK